MTEEKISETWQPRSIGIVSSMPAKGYSGGRYHVLMMARALSLAGHEVVIYTNNIPEMWQDLRILASDESIVFQRVLQKNDFATVGVPRHDVIVCVPVGGFSWVYRKSIEMAKSKSAQLVFLNFESPNWFNSLSPFRRPSWLWWPWKLTAWLADVVVSSCHESDKFARKYFYGGKETRFLAIPPSVNDEVIGGVSQQRKAPFRVFVPTRVVNGLHKGVNDFYQILSRLEAPCIVVINVDDPEDAKILDLRDRLNERGLVVSLKSAMSESSKFYEYTNANITVFPSYFEGFGYPPLESIICGTPCLSYDLPVIREVTRNAGIFSEIGDTEKMSLLLSSMQKTGVPQVNREMREALHNYYSLQAYSQRLESVFEDRLRVPKSNKYQLRFLIVRFVFFIWSYLHFGVKNWIRRSR